ncbi:MAG: hypothetical protein RL021_1463 [Bacteroidota bacterium]|jgi:ribonuclease HII
MLKRRFQQTLLEAGCDEAGRGCLAGPVFAAAVILPEGYRHPKLNDSKQVSAKNRLEVRDHILQHATAWSVASVDVEEIDSINILNASLLAMHKAVAGLKVSPELLLIDGNRFKPYPSIPHHCIIGGDGKYLSIAAASILAKTYRDEFMEGIDRDYPMYGWSRNKGYGTADHRKAIEKHGACIWHRKSFRLLPDQLQLPI